MFGIFKRLSDLERTKSATIADIVRLCERVARLEIENKRLTIQTSYRLPTDLRAGAIVSAGSGEIKPVKIPTEKTKSKKVQKPKASKAKRSIPTLKTKNR